MSLHSAVQAVRRTLNSFKNKATSIHDPLAKDVDFSIISPMVHSTISAIEAMKVQPVPILQQFLDEVIIAGSISPTFKGNNITSYNTSQEEFNKMAMTFMDKLVQNLQNRFPEVDIISAMKILDPQFCQLQYLHLFPMGLSI